MHNQWHSQVFDSGECKDRDLSWTPHDGMSEFGGESGTLSRKIFEYMELAETQFPAVLRGFLHSS